MKSTGDLVNTRLKERERCEGQGNLRPYLEEVHITMYLHGLYLYLLEKTCSRLSKDSYFCLFFRDDWNYENILTIAVLLGRWMNILEISLGFRARTLQRGLLRNSVLTLYFFLKLATVVTIQGFLQLILMKMVCLVNW